MLMSSSPKFGELSARNRAAHGMRRMIIPLRGNECSKIEQMLPETDERFRVCFDESLL